jgi:uncharacterized glyoxalase superfamily protein PhnB
LCRLCVRRGCRICYRCLDQPNDRRDQNVKATDGTVRIMGSVLYLHVDDADGLAKEWRRAGMDVSGPENYDYGKREGTHTDPDGNLIRFGSPLRWPMSR